MIKGRSSAGLYQFRFEDGACATVDPEIFFPRSGAGTSSSTYMARKICFTCPILESCREFALNTYVGPVGIWAGMSTDELRSERKRLGIVVENPKSFIDKKDYYG